MLRRPAPMNWTARLLSNLQIIEELCRICEAQSYIIKAQADALAQMGAVVMEEEQADVDRALAALIGHGEMPDKIVPGHQML